MHIHADSVYFGECRVQHPLLSGKVSFENVMLSGMETSISGDMSCPGIPIWWLMRISTFSGVWSHNRSIHNLDVKYVGTVVPSKFVCLCCGFTWNICVLGQSNSNCLGMGQYKIGTGIYRIWYKHPFESGNCGYYTWNWCGSKSCIPQKVKSPSNSSLVHIGHSRI